MRVSLKSEQPEELRVHAEGWEEAWAGAGSLQLSKEPLGSGRMLSSHRIWTQATAPIEVICPPSTPDSKHLDSQVASLKKNKGFSSLEPSLSLTGAHTHARAHEHLQRLA